MIYPTALRDAGVEGTVRLRYVVCQDGVVDPASIELVRASHMGFVPAAVWMLTRQRYRPATIRGRAVSQEVTQSVRFTLPVEEPPPPPRVEKRVIH